MTTSDHILVVDDDREIRNLLTEYLRKAGYRVTAVEDGRGMWAAVEGGRPDIVILDLMLPGDDGLALCRDLRARSKVPIIMLTARGEDTDRIVGLEMGADDYLAKPFNPRELLARVKSVLRRARTLPDNLQPDVARGFLFAGWKLDVATRNLTSPGGVVVALSGAEHKLLRIFLDHANSVLTRDQLIDLTQAREAYPFDRSIDVQVSRLRHRLGDDAKEPAIIKTVRGEGYVFAAAVEVNVIRVVPRSLFGRMVLVLLTGLIAAQALSLALHLHERGELLYRASGMQSAQRIADIVKLLDSLPAPDRPRIVALFNSPPLIVSLDTAQAAPSPVASESGAQAAFLRAILQRFLGDDRPVTVTGAGEIQQGPPISPRAMSGPPMAMRGPFGPGMRYLMEPDQSYIARVRLNDGSWITFDTRQHADTANWPYRLLLSILILLGAVIALTLLAARWVTRPLATLAGAAEELGKDIDRPPLPEKGPEEVARAARAFNRMQSRLARYIHERNRVLAAMSHDLKTPITRMRLRAELLDDGEIKIRFAQDLQEMESMVAGTLDFMRGLETEERAQPVDVMALLESLQEDAHEAGAEVTLEGSVHVPYVGRPQALKRCLRNLVDNAIKYGTSATVVVEDEPERLVIRIRDRGPGIPEQELERVFEPFHRVEGSRGRDTGGTGLGLTIARSVAQLHAGTLEVRNRQGGGLEAILGLPRK